MAGGKCRQRSASVPGNTIDSLIVPSCKEKPTTDSSSAVGWFLEVLGSYMPRNSADPPAGAAHDNNSNNSTASGRDGFSRSFNSICTLSGSILSTNEYRTVSGAV